MAAYDPSDGECPEMGELAAFVEAGRSDSAILSHLASCDACEEALVALEEEILSLQIPLSEIWFREHVSCPDRHTLSRYEGGSLQGDELAYVRFHLQQLGCPNCQARLGEESLKETPEGPELAKRSRRRTVEATSSLLGKMRGQG